MKIHMLDLFSGLGGASEAMVRDSGWSVLRIENNPLLSGVPFTVIDDVRNLQPNKMAKPWVLPNLGIDLIWASPPCTEFSGGFHAPKSIASREVGLDNYHPSLELVESAIRIIEIVKPKYWVIENVVGAIRYFKPLLGEPKQIIGPYVLWGNFPEIFYDKAKLTPKKHKDSGSRDPLRSNRRACVDFEVSQGLKFAIENQQSILDFM